MEERVRALGGELRLSNQGGACVSVTVPRTLADIQVTAGRRG
jgi:glucose-6-phosphate-specific signal transduction histidine kinase